MLAQLPEWFNIEATLESWAAPNRLLQEEGGEESCFANADLLPEHRAMVFTSILGMEPGTVPLDVPTPCEGVAVCVCESQLALPPAQEVVFSSAPIPGWSDAPSADWPTH